MRRAYSIPASALRSSSEWNSVLATSSGLGFDTLLLALSSRNVFAVSADLDLAKLVALASGRSLQIILDVPVSSVPATSPAARMLGLSESDMRARDPRVPYAERQNLPIPFSDEGKARTWINALRRRLLELEELGVAGFCCRPEPDTPEWIFPILAGGDGQSKATDAIVPLWALLPKLHLFHLAQHEEITALNRIRRENPALHSPLGLSFHNAWNENVMFFERATVDRENVVLVAISLDPGAAQEADIEIPLWKLGLSDYDTLRAEDLKRGRELVWSGKYQRIRLDPELPFAIWRVA